MNALANIFVKAIQDNAPVDWQGPRLNEYARIWASAAAQAVPHTLPINVVFDAPPGPVCGRFVEVETDDGHGINVGEWIGRPDGTWALRITELPVAS